MAAFQKAVHPEQVYRAPASFAQRGLWLLYELDAHDTSYNMTTLLRLQGDLDVHALRRALDEIVRRHDVLRATFSLEDGIPWQIVGNELHGEILSEHSVMDLSGEEQTSQMEQFVRHVAHRPFDLNRGPLFRCALLKVDTKLYRLAITLHHIVTDGWSMGIFARELAALYGAFTQGQESPLGPLPVQYADYTAWQRDSSQSETLDNRLGYWMKHLTGIPERLELPFDHQRPRTLSSHSGARLTFDVPLDLTNDLKTLGFRERATLFMTLLVAFQALLYRYSGQEDIVVSTLVAGRNHTEIEDLIGLFSNVVPLRGTVSGNRSFTELLQSARSTAFEAYEHADLPFAMLVEKLASQRGRGRTPLISVIFNLNNFPVRAWGLPGLEVTREDVTPDRVRFDLDISFIETFEGLRGTIEYSTELFDPATIKRMSEHYGRILSAAVQNPDQGIQNVSLVDENERRLLTEQWNDTKIEYPRQLCVHQAFELQAKRTPDAEALVFQDERVTFRDLNEQANALAFRLIEKGVGPEVIVAVCVERSVEMVVALLAVLKAGGAYVPLDPAYPAERLALILNDSAAPVLLTESETVKKCSAYNGSIVLLDMAMDGSLENPNCEVNSGNAAYVIYTSGSTGMPKGVVVEHQNVLNLFAAMALWIDDAASSRVWFAITTITFDISVLELLWTLCHGYKVVLHTTEINSIPAEIIHHGVSHFQCTPSLASVLMDLPKGRAAFRQLSKLIVGGEAFPPALALRLKQEVSGDLFNGYGPTETTVYSVLQCIEEVDKQVPIGRPMANTQVYILDESFSPTPIGISGELYIGGDGVARGYHRRPDLTTARFISNPFCREPNARMYRTGDLARYRQNGVIEFLGRRDDQVKIRGHRVELGEIEIVLKTHPEVQDAVAAVADDATGSHRLIAYVVPSLPESDKDLAQRLRCHVREKLPNALIPSSFVVLNVIPRTANGKIDRQALSILANNAVEYKPEYRAPKTPTELALAQFWETILKVDRIGVNDYFFNLGGHSLLAVRVLTHVSRTYSIEITLRQLLEEPTISALAQKIDHALEMKAVVRLEPISRVVRNGPLAVSVFQEGRLSREFMAEMHSRPYRQGRTPFALYVEGNLRIEALENAINEIIDRHEVFRAAISPIVSIGSLKINNWNDAIRLLRSARIAVSPTVEFWQTIRPHRFVKLTVINLEQLNCSDRDSEIHEIISNTIRTRFDYASAPLMRAVMVKVSASKYLLIISISHLISDGWSVKIFQRELWSLYGAFATKSVVSLPDLPVQYADFCAWQRQRLQGDVVKNSLIYWERQFRGFVPIDVESLPFAHSQQSENEMASSVEMLFLNSSICDKLRSLAQELKVTPYVGLLSAFALVMRIYTDRQRIGLWAFFANRTHPDIEDLIGWFAIDHMISVDFSSDLFIVDLFRQVQNTVWNAQVHQETPIPFLKTFFPKDQQPIVGALRVTFELLTWKKEDSPLELAVSKAPLPRNHTEFALRILVDDNGKEISIAAQYRTDIFDQAGIVSMLTNLKSVLQRILYSPSARVSSLPSWFTKSMSMYKS